MPRNVCGIRACAYARVPALHGPCKLSTYRGKVRVRPCVPRLCALEGASLGATCMHEPALFSVPVQVHVCDRACGLLCGARSRALWTMCDCGELVQYGSWAGACDNEIACSVLAYVSVYRCVRVRESVPQYGPRPPGLRTSVYFRAVRASPAFVRCEPTKTLCFGVLYELRELLCGASLHYKGSVPLCTVRAPRALRSASLQRLSTVYERQELCAVRASKGFLPCTSAKSFARCEPPTALCLCVL